MRDDVAILRGDAEPQALRVERAVAHEVAHELGELRRHRPGNAGALVGCPVEFAERRQLDILRLADEAVQHQRHTVARGDLGEAPPHPVAIGVDDLDPVRRRALNAVAASRLDGDDLLEAVHVEARCLARPLVGRHLDVEVLPLRPDGVTEGAQPHEPAARRDEAVPDEAAGRCEHRGLRVAEAVHLAEVERFVPRAPRGGEQVVGHDVGVVDVADRGAVLGDHADHRGRVRPVAGERPHAVGDLGRLAVGPPGHERGDRGRVGAALVGVVREPARHQQRAEVRVAEPELAVGLRVRARSRASGTTSSRRGSPGRGRRRPPRARTPRRRARRPRAGTS